MKGVLALRKLAPAVAVCLAVLCLPGYSTPTPEQVKERTELLVQALITNDVERVKVCIKLGADINAKLYQSLNTDHWGIHTNKPPHSNYAVYTTLIYEAMFHRNKDIIELLIKSGADVNTKSINISWGKGFTALMFAAQVEDKDIAELLINSGADVNAKDDNGWTALMLAAEKASKDVAKLLINSDADVNAKDNRDEAALIKTIDMFTDHDKDIKGIAEILINAGADVNAKDSLGLTVLAKAYAAGYKDVAELLINSGADVNAGYWPALMTAAYSGDKDMAELLIKAGADVNARVNDGNDDWTALMFAAKEGKTDVAELLIKAGADVDSELIYEIQSGNTVCAELLIQLGANPNATDSDGLTLLTYAILYGQNDIADLLRAAGAKE